MKNITRFIIAGAAILTLASCTDFLDRPTIDNYNVSNFYKNDTQVEQGVNYLYNSPWYDFQRGFIKVGEVMSGNITWSGSPYLDFTTNGTDLDLVSMSYSLWAVNGHANTVIDNILGSEGPSQAAKNKAIGEALTLKALAYFFMVRSFGEVPIVHNNTELLGTGEYNKIQKATRASVYEYIIMTLEKAMELLPKNAHIGEYNRIDYYAAEALLAKTYLTKAGLGGSLNADDLAKAAEYAKDVIDNSGRSLTPVYSDVFRLSPKVYNATGECLISWLWTAEGSQWTRQNTLQSDLAYAGFGDQADLWGDWEQPSVDLARAFGASAADDPAIRKNEKDSRRVATLMLPGDYYPYFWTDRGGFDFGRFLYDPEYGLSESGAKLGPGQLQIKTGTMIVKHLYGDNADHEAGVGHAPARMAYTLPTHILRLSDVYLIYAEAVCSTNNAEALEYVNKVRARAGADPLTSVTLQDIWKERRLELACEGDYWYDFVRRSYWQIDDVIAEIKAQKRSQWSGGLDVVYKKYVTDGVWDIVLLTEPTADGSGVSGWQEGVENQVYYGTNGVKGQDDEPAITAGSFTLPFPTEDVVFNGNMASTAPAVDVDVRSTYVYNF